MICDLREFYTNGSRTRCLSGGVKCECECGVMAGGYVEGFKGMRLVGD